MQEKYNVTGMTCAACSARVEKSVSALPGVQACSVNLLKNSMVVSYAENELTSSEIIHAVEKAGYGASVQGSRGESGARSPADTARRRNAEERRRRTQPAARSQRRAGAELSISLPLLTLLTVAVIATLFLCYRYLCLNASIDARMDHIEQLEAQLENLKTENDALEQSIDTSVDLNYVYDVAVNELGMIHAGKDNIISYDKTESEYVRQYEDIPKE